MTVILSFDFEQRTIGQKGKVLILQIKRTEQLSIIVKKNDENGKFSDVPA
jgi:hypothetical protein